MALTLASSFLKVTASSADHYLQVYQWQAKSDDQPELLEEDWQSAISNNCYMLFERLLTEDEDTAKLLGLLPFFH